MARLPRLDLPGIPQHVIQRGNNRATCFCNDVDRLVYLKSLAEAAIEMGCEIHAYVLMTNHVHLLASGKAAGAVSAVMQSVGRRYVRYFNRMHKRSGTLYEGRFKSSLVESGRYLWTCYRYIELNPVRASMVDTPGQHLWSSHRHNAFGEPDPLITAHPEYTALGPTVADRQLAYRALFDEDLPAEDIEAIRLHANKDCALGSTRFQGEIESATKRRARVVVPGRPRKSVPENLT